MTKRGFKKLSTEAKAEIVTVCVKEAAAYAIK